MNKSTRRLLIFLMVPFFLGVLLHFLIPFFITISSNPKLEQAYNNYKIEVEQDTVRALSFLNSKVVNNRLQIFENIRSTFIRLYQRSDINEQNCAKKFVLNNIFQAQQNKAKGITLQNTNNSMWYNPKVNSTEEFTEQQQAIYSSYVRIEPFIPSLYTSSEQLYRGLLYIETMIGEGDEFFYFHFPSEYDDAFFSSNISMIAHFFNKTIENFEDNGNSDTLFRDHSGLKSCVPLIGQNRKTVFCIGICITALSDDIISTLSIPEFQYSSNTYYLVKPFYDQSFSPWPTILFNFSDLDLSNVATPIDQALESPLPLEWLDAKVDYQLKICRENEHEIHYIIPITTYNSTDIYNVCMYLIVKNRFSKSLIDEENYFRKILTLMVVPASIILIASIFLAICLLKSIFHELNEGLDILSSYCLLFLKEDMELDIPDYEGPNDIKAIFDQFQKLNFLNKYSNPSYFNCSKQERLIRYINCLNFFDSLSYNTSHLCENIADCFTLLEDYPNCIIYLEKSIERHRQDIDENGEVEIRRRKTSKFEKNFQKAVRRKLLKLIRALYAAYQPNDQITRYKLKENVKKLKKIAYPKILNNEYIAASVIQIRFQLRDGDLENMGQNISLLKDLIDGYEKIHSNKESKIEQCWTHPDIMRSYLNFILGSWHMKIKNFLSAFDFYVLSLQSSVYNPLVHRNTFTQLEGILRMYQINPSPLKELKFRWQEKERQEREYIFLIDVSNPEMKKEEILRWKNKGRKMADFILSSFVQEEDRVSISEFCQNLKVNCNLMKVKNQMKIIRKQLLSSLKCREQNIYSQLRENLIECIDRVRNLMRQKIFIIFLKPGFQIGQDYLSSITSVQNSLFIFVGGEDRIGKTQQENYFVIGLEDREDVARILQDKQIQKAENLVYIL